MTHYPVVWMFVWFLSSYAALLRTGDLLEVYNTFSKIIFNSSLIEAAKKIWVDGYFHHNGISCECESKQSWIAIMFEENVSISNLLSEETDVPVILPVFNLLLLQFIDVSLPWSHITCRDDCMSPCGGLDMNLSSIQGASCLLPIISCEWAPSSCSFNLNIMRNETIE